MTLHWPATVTNLASVAALAAEADETYDHLRVTAVLDGDQVRVQVLMYPPGDPVAKQQMRAFLDMVSRLEETAESLA